VRERVARVVLLLLAAGGLVPGVWAGFAPRAFYDATFATLEVYSGVDRTVNSVGLIVAVALPIVLATVAPPRTTSEEITVSA
jgi:hypothetical protein